MSVHNRVLAIFASSTSIIFILACQSVFKFISPNTPDPNRTPQMVSIYDGDWQGTTSQNLKVTFAVTHSEIISMKVQVTLVGPACITWPTLIMGTLIEPTALASGNFTPSYPIKNGAFTVTGLVDMLEDTSYTFTGTFSSSNAASGTFEYTALRAACNGTVVVNWTAER